MSKNTLGIESGDVVAVKNGTITGILSDGVCLKSDGVDSSFVAFEHIDRIVTKATKPNQSFSVLSTSVEARERAEHIIINREDLIEDPAAYIMLRGGEIRPFKNIQYGSLGPSAYPQYQVIWKGYLTDAT